MIAIIDNGEDHSGHAVTFLDIGDVDPERVLPLVLKMDSHEFATASVLGLAASIDWRDPSGVEKLSDYWSIIGRHEAEGVWDDITFVRWDDNACLAYVARQQELDAASTEEIKDAIWERPWTPEDAPPCTCIAGKIYRAANPTGTT